ncbi:NADAR family protein [Actinoplanes sp. CA-015351]|uniref:NADAR family protein n=1 Tax=Actinoplanes sp. CA-015351 TaxID=3239897 RepID=UPI003D96B354
MSATARSVTDLLKTDTKLKYLYFWGHQPERDGSVGAGCLSQWSAESFTVDGRRFSTAEHYMMWRKATLFGDEDTAERILAAPHPKAAKDLGGRATGFDQQTWNEHRFAVVVDGNLAKFTQHPALGAYLRGTGRRVLVEASPMDRIWGIGLARDDERAADPRRWRGLNLLGFALMEVRDRLG